MLATASHCRAQLFGITPFGTNPDLLFTIDKTTGASTAVGSQPVGFSDLTSLAFNASGVLYGFDTDDDILLTIDTATGLGSSVSRVNRTGLNSLVFSPDGVLYAYDVVTDELVTIDPPTGNTTSIGAINNLIALDFSPSGILYGVINAHVGQPIGTTDLLVTIDPSNALTSPVGTDATGFHGITELAIDSEGVLFASDLTGDSRVDDFLVTIDTTTGRGSRVGRMTGFGFVTGLAFYPIPEPSGCLSLACLSLLCA